MNQTDMPRPLTDAELSRLLAPVPMAHQQRDELVRIALRPGLPANYVGPVELADLQLSLSPWHWLKHELATSPRTAALNQKLARKHARVGGQDTMAEIGIWLYEDKLTADDGESLFASIHPGDSIEWGHYGVVSDRDGHFMHPSFDLRVVIFFAEDSSSSGIAVTQAVWGGWQAKAESLSPVSILTANRVCHYDWLYNSDQLWLTDSTTGQSCALDPKGDWLGDDEEADNPNDWTGTIPGQAQYQSGIENGFLVVEAGLLYEAGQLYRADTNALLTVGLPRPESATA